MNHGARQGNITYIKKCLVVGGFWWGYHIQGGRVLFLFIGLGSWRPDVPCNSGLKNTEEHWQTVIVVCPHWVNMQWTIMTLLGRNHHDIYWEDATVVDADPICTVAEHLMHGTSVSSKVHCHVFSFFLPARPFSAHFWLFLHFIPAVRTPLGFHCHWWGLL